jgi:hypothetical protein
MGSIFFGRQVTEWTRLYASLKTIFRRKRVILSMLLMAADLSRHEKHVIHSILIALGLSSLSNQVNAAGTLSPKGSLQWFDCASRPLDVLS